MNLLEDSGICKSLLIIIAKIPSKKNSSVGLVRFEIKIWKSMLITFILVIWKRFWLPNLVWLKYNSCFIKPNILSDEVVLSDGYIDIEKAGTIAISGLDGYYETKWIERLSYAKPKTELKEI